MAENAQEKKKSQQNLLSFVSHNLSNKMGKEKEKGNSKNSAEKNTHPNIDKLSAPSGPKQQKPRLSASANASTSGANTLTTISATNKQGTQGGSTGSSRPNTIKTSTRSANLMPKTHPPQV